MDSFNQSRIEDDMKGIKSQAISSGVDDLMASVNPLSMKRGIKGINIDDLELRAMIKVMDAKFN